MSTTTTNYNLVKPEYYDDADIADINGNMDAIDTQMKANADAIATASSSISTVSALATEVDGSHSGDNANVTITAFHLKFKGKLAVCSFNFQPTASIAAWSKITTLSKGGLDHIYTLALAISHDSTPDIRVQVRTNGDVYVSTAPIVNDMYALNFAYYTA